MLTLNFGFEKNIALSIAPTWALLLITVVLRHYNFYSN